MDQEQIMQMQIMEQEANQFGQQSQLIDQNINEMEDLELSLDEIENKESEEMLINLGKKIYLPVNIKEGKPKLIVEIGKGNFAKKSIGDTKKIINGQLEKLKAAKIEINNRLADIQTEMMRLVQDFEKSSKNQKDKIGDVVEKSEKDKKE